MSEQLTEHGACRAVAHALRPSQRAAIERATPADTTVEDRILTAMLTDEHLDRTGPWWSATGAGVSAALQDFTGADQGSASFLVGAALHAHILSGGDTHRTDLILALAERAVAWDAGARWAVAAVVTA